MDYTPTRSAGALRRTPPTTAIRGGEEALEYRRPGTGPVPFKGFDTAAEAEQEETEEEDALEEQYSSAEAGGARRARREAPAVHFEQSNASRLKPLAVPASEGKFLDLIKAFGTKMNIQLTGPDNYSDWLQKLQKLSARLKCKTALTDQGVNMVDEDLWEQMEGTVEDMIIGSIP
jgi:hypothetical protein